MDYAKLLYAAEVRSLGSALLNGATPRELRDDDYRNWQRENRDKFILKADEELKRVAALIGLGD